MKVKVPGVAADEEYREALEWLLQRHDIDSRKIANRTIY